MIKIATIFGTRPEIIRLNIIMKKLDKYFQHIMINTNQNYDDKLNKIFLDEFDLRGPDYNIDSKSDNTFEQIGKILSNVEKILIKEKPDGVLILGDTNSGLSSIVAKRLNIPVFHLEAGNRCYDATVPEETNRKVIDACTSVYMPYTYRSMENLINEGVRRSEVYVVGNPIYEVINSVQNMFFQEERTYYLATLHRAECVDNPKRLSEVITGLNRIANNCGRVKFLIHPRTVDKLKFLNCSISSNIELINPCNFTDFLKLEAGAICVISDSGTVQEECCIFNIPNVTVREVTERPETLECGSNILSGYNADDIETSVKLAVDIASYWNTPEEYLKVDVSNKVIKIIKSYFARERL